MSKFFKFDAKGTIEQEKPVGYIEKSQQKQNTILSEYRIRNVLFPNRIVLTPLCMYSSEDGFFNDWHLVHLGQFAIRGVGLIFTEATAISPNGRISPQDTGIWKDEHIENLKIITSFIHKYKGKAGIQLAHAGRKSSTYPPFHKRAGQTVPVSEGGWNDIVGPSPISWDNTFLEPKELTIEEIEDIKLNFRNAAIRADKANFDVLEIHSAHGYLLHSFLSPISNKRTDKYGGNFENRIRLILEIIDTVKKVWPEEKLLFVRISCTDWVSDKESWDLKQSVELSKILRDKKVDLIDCSSGGNSSKQKIEAAPLFQAKFSKEIKLNAKGLSVGAVGLILDIDSANKVIENECADLVFMGRELMRNPSFVLEASHKMNIPIVWPNQYHKAIPNPHYRAF